MVPGHRPAEFGSVDAALDFTVSYSTVAKPLFAARPEHERHQPGHLGDCYLLASSPKSPARIRRHLLDDHHNGNNTYGVRFYVNGVARIRHRQQRLANGGTNSIRPQHVGEPGREGLCRVQASGVVTGDPINDGNSFSTIGNGGAPEYTLEEITAPRRSPIF